MQWTAQVFCVDQHAAASCDLERSGLFTVQPSIPQQHILWKDASIVAHGPLFIAVNGCNVWLALCGKEFQRYCIDGALRLSVAAACGNLLVAGTEHGLVDIFSFLRKSRWFIKITKDCALFQGAIGHNKKFELGASSAVRSTNLNGLTSWVQNYMCTATRKVEHCLKTGKVILKVSIFGNYLLADGYIFTMLDYTSDVYHVTWFFYLNNLSKLALGYIFLFFFFIYLLIIVYLIIFTFD